jgi:hypothetical protein
MIRGLATQVFERRHPRNGTAGAGAGVGGVIGGILGGVGAVLGAVIMPAASLRRPKGDIHLPAGRPSVSASTRMNPN